MLGIDGRTLRIVWTIFLFTLLLVVVYYIRHTLILFAASIFFAYMLWPMVSLIERFIPRRRTVALALVYSLFIGLLVLLGFAIVPKLIAEATNLLSSLPKLLAASKLATIALQLWLAVIAGILSFIPVIGSAAAFIILLIVAAVAGRILIAVAIIWGAFHLFQ